MSEVIDPRRRLRVTACRLAILPVLLALIAALALPGAARAGFRLGLQDPAFDGSATAEQSASGYEVLNLVGGSVVRLNTFWSDIAPNRPAGGGNPADPAYRWASLDVAVRTAAAHHVTPLLTISTAPLWAQRGHQPSRPIGLGAWNPDPKALAQFSEAVATRYDGHFPDPLAPGQSLPRVTYIELWNEENLPLFLAAPHLIPEYRAMLSQAYRAIKRAVSGDRVVMGGLAPVSYKPGTTVSPLTFAAQMMCLRRTGTRFLRTRHCTAAPFDIFAEHPYSLAVTPTQPAGSYDDVLVADVHKLRDLLNAASRLHTIGRGPHPLWFTEWGWVTRPPDRQVGDSFSTAARYVAFSVYEMWRAGGSLIIWQAIHDGGRGQLSGAGLETQSGRAKPQLSAFAFPFIAMVHGARGYAWGRVPSGGGTRVAIQRRAGRGWRTVAHARAGADGVFATRFGARGNAVFRAQGPASASLPYDSRPIPARRTHAF